ncbi:hypothetical protein K443DRAFT_683536 [Laccaria amethystina LaAM-08-1]|uniref:Uncharacterized protein n=1 Tax=Laccaria amethystina LaAM-08-1 TaxID=1095629 RepID=A0A0C9WSM2_9AGAR|nr:hypothetical protein K443DRAFT_683536 [Laccaria amethystina LaAM-08-1]
MPPHDPQSTHHRPLGNPKRQLNPFQLVTLTCKRVDSSIVGSKLVWEELNKRASVVNALGPRIRIFRMRRCT